VSRELEPNGDELDASYPEGGARLLSSPGEDDEPSLGSFDRMTDQSKSWKRMQGEFGAGDDAEQDNADDEDSDPAEEGEASGIADYDGLLEVMGSPDWHGPRGGMI